MKTYVIVFICVLTTLHCTKAASKQKSKSVTTFIEAKWEVTPLVLEVAEFLADENENYFWEFVDAISVLNPPLIDLDSDQARYDRVLAEAGELISPSQLAVLKLALSLHTYSPKVEMYAQMALERGLETLRCPIAADVGGTLVCQAEELEKTIAQVKAKDGPHLVESFGLDHHCPGSQNHSLVVVLYGELGTPEFASFHLVLKEQASAGLLDYVLRHYVLECPNRRVRLSGYGVELQIKSTEYKVQDDTRVREDGATESGEQQDENEEIEGFHFNRLKALYPDMKESLDKFRQHLLDSSSELAPLKVWEVQELSLQAAERIVAAPREEALKMLTTIAQNFPLQARSLVHTHVSPELKREVKNNQEAFANALNLQSSDTALFLNGMFFDLDIVDVISLLEVVRQELRVMEGLYRIGISQSRMSSLLALDFGGSSSNNHEYAIDIRDSAVIWINDIELDKQYRRWSDSLMELLRPTFPGMLRSIRRNLYHLVIVADPAKAEARSLLKLAESFYVHLAPLRIGLVFAVNPDPSAYGLTDAGVALLNAFNYVAEQKDAYSGLSFLTDVFAQVKEDNDVTVEDVMNMMHSKYPSASSAEILGEDSEYDTGRRLAQDFVQKSGLRTFPQVLMNGIPLPDNVLNADNFEEGVLSEIMAQTTVFQKAVYKSELTNSDNTLDFIMNQPNVMPRLNNRILSSDRTFLDVTGSVRGSGSVDLENFQKLSSRDKTAVMLQRWLRYFHGSRSHPPHILTNWVAGDLQTAGGRSLLLSALEHMKSSGVSRVAAIVNPTTLDGPQHFNLLVLAALRILSPQAATTLMTNILSSADLAEALASGSKTIADVTVPGLELGELTADLASGPNEIDLLLMKAHRIYCQTVLGAPGGGQVVVSNGRVVGPLEEKEDFVLDDFALLERYSLNLYGDKILQALKAKANDDDEDDEIDNSDTLMQAVALLVSRPQTRSRFEIPSRGEEHSVVKLPARLPDQPALDIVVIVDPVSRGAQKVGPILSVLHETLNCNVKVFLNCVEKSSDMPLKSFYRFVLEPEVQFTSEGHQAPGPIARFSNMPTSVLLTQNMQVPENWLVEVVRSPYDLDNIKLEDVESGVHSEFELEYLLLEGHCFEANTGNPPRGLQITLGTESNPIVVDTIVMANLGYFQLKANPGAWILRLREGRSADIFEIVSHDGSDTPANSSDIKVVLSSFRSHVLKIRVAKKPDKQHLDLLADDDAQPGLWNSITSTFGSGGKKEEDEEERINIFSLASGHLYERFLRIMMMSVLKHTSSPVKFWFLKNYLSPTLKDFLPHMAHEYGFEYELVQYKWPRWLHQQTEKQRIIWGYKILFLDVLFPLNVRKIIFVDADQVVRADMKELVELDLGGAPYGYTPFCDSRREMDGFRFWKQGYWRNHLQGRTYHISALYVVDLRRFRRIAAGDRLRGQYQALSQDPNSLSNLDQDLPNNMIHQVAIKSLPQEWLWCETWCDDASKAYAKTIDLCNNPLTKEAKLTAAMRILPEWKDYDAEIKRLQQRIDHMHTEEGMDAESVAQQISSQQKLPVDQHSASHSEL